MASISSTGNRKMPSIANWTLWWVGGGFVLWSVMMASTNPIWQMCFWVSGPLTLSFTSVIIMIWSPSTWAASTSASRCSQNTSHGHLCGLAVLTKYYCCCWYTVSGPYNLHRWRSINPNYPCCLFLSVLSSPTFQVLYCLLLVELPCVLFYSAQWWLQCLVGILVCSVLL